MKIFHSICLSVLLLASCVAEANTMKRLVFVKVPMESLRNLSELAGMDEIDTCKLVLRGDFVNEGPRGYYCEALKLNVNRLVKLHGINCLIV